MHRDVLHNSHIILNVQNKQKKYYLALIKAMELILTEEIIWFK